MKLALGTVQFGLHYGVSNQSGRPSTEEINKILTLAERQNIKVLDTAIGYGDSHTQLRHQQVCQRGFDLVTKLPPLNKSKFGYQDIQQYLTYLEQIFEDLDTSSIKGLMFHQAEDIIKPNVEPILQKIEQLKAEKKVQQLGVSLYSTSPIDDILGRTNVDIVQLPFNALDRYFESQGLLEVFHTQSIEVHARSLFLQGLLLIGKGRYPKYFQPWADILLSVDKLAQHMNVSKLTLCLAYLMQQNHISKWVVGVNFAYELGEIIDAYEQAKIVAQETLPNLSVSDPKLTNPALWQLT